MFAMPYIFIWIGAAIFAPETLWWLLITRPRERALKKVREHNRLIWSIRALEEEVLGIRWCGEAGLLPIDTD